jgi:CBS domain-containing protein
MRARDIMTPSPGVVTPEAPVHHAAAIMEDRDVGFVPVVADPRGMQLVGVITDRDIAVRCVAHHFTPDRCVRDCMTTGALATVSADAEVHHVLAVMERARVRRVPVVDAEDRVLGVISQGDLARRLGPAEPDAIETLVERLSAPAT